MFRVRNLAIVGLCLLLLGLSVVQYPVSIEAQSAGGSLYDFQEIGQLNTLSGDYLEFNGDLGYTVDGDCEAEGFPPVNKCTGVLSAFDSRNPQSMSLLGQLSVGEKKETLRGLAVHGKYVYSNVFTYPDYGPPSKARIGIFDVSNPQAITEVASIPDIASAPRIHNDKLVLTTRSGLLFYDITDPTSPVEVGRIADRVVTAHFSGSLAYVLIRESATSFYSKLVIFDISDLAHPVKVYTHPSGFATARALWVFGDKLYVVYDDEIGGDRGATIQWGSSILEWDLPDPQKVGEFRVIYNGGTIASTLLKTGNTLLALKGGSVVGFNVTDPKAAKVLSFILEVAGEEWGVRVLTVKDNTFYATTRVSKAGLSGQALRAFRFRAPVAHLPLLASSAYAQGPIENNFGIGDADKGGSITNWDNEPYYTIRSLSILGGTAESNRQCPCATEIG